MALSPTTHFLPYPVLTAIALGIILEKAASRSLSSMVRRKSYSPRCSSRILQHVTISATPIEMTWGLTAGYRRIYRRLVTTGAGGDLAPDHDS